MNGSLINPFHISHPTTVQTSLYSAASSGRFDPSGRYIAAARPDGFVLVWDLETRAAIRWLNAHVRSVTSVDWSRHSRYLLTASKDWNVLRWDLASDSEPYHRHSAMRFDAPVVAASFHPRNSLIVLALLSTGDAYVVDLRKEHRGRVELCEVQEDMAGADGGTGDDVHAQPTRPQSAMITARFDPSGKHIFVGTSSGSVLVFNTRTKTMVARHKISGAGAIKGLDFAKSGRRLVTNSSDRTIRQFNLPSYVVPAEGEHHLEQELEPTHRFHDPINKTAWHTVAYSPDGDWLAGGAADPATHKIYIWDISNDGQFVCALDGGREPLVYLHWHPYKSSIASTTNQGNILIWHSPTPERWGAFAGGFEEVDENVEYEEREDEFDIEDEEEMARRKMKAEEEEVDVTGMGEDEHERRVAQAMGGGAVEHDEDMLWADEEPDEDIKGFSMKIVINAEDQGDFT